MPPYSCQHLLSFFFFYYNHAVLCSVTQLCLTLCNPRDCSPLAHLSMKFPGKDTGVGCHFLLQEIFSIQRLNPNLWVSCVFFTTAPPRKHYSHANKCEMVSRCHFNMFFSDGKWYWTSFYMLIGCLYFIFHLWGCLVTQPEKAMAPTPVLLPGKSHARRSLPGCGPWGREESDRTEQLHFPFSLSCIGEGNGSPLQCSCLENPRDGGAWWAAVYGVAQSRTRLKRLSCSSSSDSVVKNSPVSAEDTWVWFLGWEDLLEKEMETHPSILVWEIPSTEEPGGLQSMGSQKSCAWLGD